MEEDLWWASLSEAEQRELLRKGLGPRGEADGSLLLA